VSWRMSIIPALGRLRQKTVQDRRGLCLTTLKKKKKVGEGIFTRWGSAAQFSAMLQHQNCIWHIVGARWGFVGGMDSWWMLLLPHCTKVNMVDSGLLCVLEPALALWSSFRVSVLRQKFYIKNGTYKLRKWGTHQNGTRYNCWTYIDTLLLKVHSLHQGSL
jgi:hypothetical protein